MGNKEGWAEFKMKSADQGVATHVYAAFDPSLKGKSKIDNVHCVTVACC